MTTRKRFRLSDIQTPITMSHREHRCEVGETSLSYRPQVQANVCQNRCCKDNHSARRTVDGYYYYPEGDVGYPVAVEGGAGRRASTARREQEPPAATPTNTKVSQVTILLVLSKKQKSE